MTTYYDHNRSYSMKQVLALLIMLLAVAANAQLTQNFSGTTFPPSGWSVYNDPSYTANLVKRSATVNGYATSTGMGAVYVDFWNAPVGTKDSLKTPVMTPTIAGDSLIFDHAHAAATTSTLYDSIAIFVSPNGGTSWNRLESLVGSKTNIGCQTCLSTVSGGLSTEWLSPSASDWMTKKYPLPIGTNRIAFVFYSGFSENLFMDNIIVSRNTTMIYDSAAAIQITDTVFQGMNSAAVLNAKVYATNTINPLPVTAITANTSGSTAAGDILAARLYYSGTTGTFNSTTATLLATVNNPSGSFTFTGFSQNLSGTNSNFWIAYDISSTAIVGHVLDATFESITVNGNASTPVIMDPAGTRYIQSYKDYRYCFWTTISTINYLSGPTNVTIGTINNSTGDLNQTTSYASQSTALVKGDSAQIFVSIGPGNTEQLGIYVDWNNNGQFDMPQEQVYAATNIPGGGTIGLPLAAPVAPAAYIKVPCTASKGFHRFRVVSDLTSVSACGPVTYGDGEDYSLEVKDQPMPVAVFNAPDTFYTNGAVAFTNMSTGSGLTTEWDYQDDGTYDATTKNGVFQYATNGLYTVKLRMKSVGCSGTFFDSTTKSIRIITPPAVTSANFISDKNVVSITDIATLYDLSTYGPGAWSWSISPATVGGSAAYTYKNGTTSSSQNPQLTFTQYGKYTVTLTATNALGSNSITKNFYINCVRSVNMCGGGNNATTTDDAGFLYDDGGKDANYTSNHFCTLLIKPACAAQIQLKFKMLDLSTQLWTSAPLSGADWIKIYDGTSAAGVPLHSTINYPNGLQNLIGNISWVPPTLTATSGSMYIEYSIDLTGNQRGFEAEWSTVPIIGNTPPTATFNVPDTIFTGVGNTYTCTASGTNNTYDWDFNNDGVYDASGPSVNYTFASPTTTTIKCVISSCQGTTTLTKVARVMDPFVAPIPRFRATFTGGTPTDVFQLLDESKYGPSSWQWTITPATYTLVNGNLSSQNIDVKFNATGYYTVRLRVANAFGADSLTKTNYLKVFIYCTPNVSQLDPDMGISNVSFGNINNTTSQGLAAYTDYAALGTTAMELGASYQVTIKRTSNNNAINRKVWVDLNGNGLFTDAGEMLFEEPNSTSLSVTGTITIPVTATPGNSRLRVGVNAASQPNLGCGANYFGEYEDYKIEIVPDVTKPVISLNGSDTVYIEAGYVFNDPGASATDNVTSPQTVTTTYIGFTNGTAIPTPGTYSINYTAVDGAGNLSARSRKVMVTPDVTKPVITLNGSDTITIAVGGVFTDPGATANDFYFGPVSPVIVLGVVNTSIVANYTLVYMATDLHGNAAITKTRVVMVVDTIKPVITVNGANPFLWDVHRKPFVDPGVTVTDNYCTTGLNASASSINLDVLGTYTITYTFKDCNGNIAASVTRTVIVQDTMAPTLTFSQNTDTFLIDVNTLTALPEPGYSLGDNHYTAAQLNVARTGTVNLNVLGTYPVEYTVTDPSSNKSRIYTRIFKVVDRVKPVITLTGPSVANVYRWQVYNDLGATVTDNYYTTLTPLVSGSVNVHLPGIYYLLFDVTDPSGNVADQKTRIVNVLESISGINGSKTENGFILYPNPTTGKVTLEVKTENVKDIRVSVYDMIGNKVMDMDDKQISSGKFDFDLSGLAAGNYLLQCTTGTESINKKVTVISK